MRQSFLEGGGTKGPLSYEPHLNSTVNRGRSCEKVYSFHLEILGAGPSGHPEKAKWALGNDEESSSGATTAIRKPRHSRFCADACALQVMALE